MSITQKLLQVQKKIPKIDKDGNNPHFKSKYASLPNVLSTVLPILQEHGILYSAVQDTFDSHDYLVVQLIDTESGESLISKVKLIGINDMQKLGSAHTYACRYGLLNLLGICPDIDDDGNVASDKEETKQPTKETKKVEKKTVTTSDKPDVDKVKQLLQDKDHLLSDAYKIQISQRIEEGNPDAIIKIQKYLENLK